MPCKDVTELIRIVLDADDRLAEYVFAKRTCGQGVGAESLLIDQLGGRSVGEILSVSVDDFLSEYSFGDEVEEFLSLKHLFALQGALEVLTGKEPGRAGDAFAAGEISFDGTETIIQGRISVDVVAEKIEACGGCGSCGSSEQADEGRRKNAERRAAREAVGTSA